MKRTLLIFIILLAIAGVGFLAYTALRSDDTNQATNTEEAEDTSSPQPEQPAMPQTFTFAQTKKAAHYVSSAPAHEAVLESTPSEVSISFNFDLSPKSTVSVAKDDQDVSTGAATISADKLILSKVINTDAGSGLYTVKYNACWPDGSCHDGQFQFGVK